MPFDFKITTFFIKMKTKNKQKFQNSVLFSICWKRFLYLENMLSDAQK